jgi:hypothetical protein
MSVSIASIVRRSIRHALQMSKHGFHDWRTARAALTRILDDLESRSSSDPAIERLRRFIARGDRDSNHRDETQGR